MQASPAAMHITSTSQTTPGATKRPSGDDFTVDRLTKKPKLWPQNHFDSGFVGRLAHEVKYKAEMFANRRQFVKAILLKQRKMSLGAGMLLIHEQLRSSAAKPSVELENLSSSTPEAEDSESVSLTPPTSSAPSTAAREDTSHWVRRSTRKRTAMDVQYVEDSDDEFLEVEEKATSKSAPIPAINQTDKSQIRVSGRKRDAAGVEYVDDSDAEMTESLLAEDKVAPATARKSTVSKTGSKSRKKKAPKKTPTRTKRTTRAKATESRTESDEQQVPEPEPAFQLEENGSGVDAPESDQAHMGLTQSTCFTYPESALRESLALIIDEDHTGTNNEAVQDVPATCPKTPAPPQQPKKRGGRPPRPRMLGTEDFFTPANDFKFKYDSPTGRTAAQLNALLAPPARPPISAWDANGLYDYGIGPLSYDHLGSRPKTDLAAKLVEQMEVAHAAEAEKVEKEQEVKYRMQDMLKGLGYEKQEDEVDEDGFEFRYSVYGKDEDGVAAEDDGMPGDEVPEDKAPDHDAPEAEVGYDMMDWDEVDDGELTGEEVMDED